MDRTSTKQVASIIRFVGLREHPAKRGARVVVYLLLVTAIYQVLLFNYNSDSFFDPVGWLDPFMYVGYGLYYSIPDVMNDYYKVSRLPWDLLQFAARQIFRPDIASFVIQFVSFSGMSVAAYTFFRQLINRSAALLIAILCIFFPIAYSNGGADYHNTITGLLYFSMLASATAAIVAESLLIAMVAGAAIALALHTNPTLVMLGPGIALLMSVLWWERRRGLRFALTAPICLIIGAVAATVVLGLVSKAFGRGFWFFIPQLDYVLWAQDNDHKLWPYPLTWDGLKGSTSNAYVFGVFLVSLAELVRLGLGRQIKKQADAAAAHGGFILTCLIAAGLELKGQPILEPAYMLYGVVLAAFVPLGYLLNSHLRPESPKQFDLFAVCLPIVSGCAIFGSAWIYSAFHLKAVQPAFLCVAALAVLYLGLVVARAGQFSLAVVVLLAALNVTLIPDRATFARAKCHATRELNVFIEDASLVATRLAGHPGHVFAFADPEEHMTEPCFANRKTIDVASSFTEIAHNFLGKPFGQQQLDQLTHDDFSAVAAAGGAIALFAANEAVRQRLVAKATALGFELATAAVVPNHQSGVVLYLLKPALL